MVPILAIVIRALWLVIEYPYLRRYRVSPAKDWDKHSAKLWDAANAIEPVGMIIGFTDVGRIQTGNNFIAVLGLALLLAGVAFRWAAIYTLGKYFTGMVLIKSDHRFVRSGLYKHLRHPAYTGALVAHLGLGLSFSNWFSLSLSFVPFLWRRCIACVSRSKHSWRLFGEEYIMYSRNTNRLIPKVY